jgi:putative solute:sodium symporter small subunit
LGGRAERRIFAWPGGATLAHLCFEPRHAIKNTRFAESGTRLQMMDAGLNRQLSPKQLRLRRYWRRTRRLTLWLLLCWVLLSFVLTYFARELSFSFFGWPFSFWVASQGALLGYCLIVAVYAYAMHRLDVEHSPHWD